MDELSNGASLRHEDDYLPWEQTGEEGVESEREETDETLGRELASFAFLREDDEREVRLHFRDVPADEVARAFRRAGALFISMTGERARAMQPPTVQPPDSGDDTTAEEVPPLSRRRRKRRSDTDSQAGPARPLGELTMRYFFTTATLVYTVIITMSTGMMQSIGGVYPSAQLSERELQTRLSTTFQ
jgi:hypothetical protein